MKNVKQLLNAKGTAMGGVMLRECNSDLKGYLPDEISGIKMAIKQKKRKRALTLFCSN
jgi:hypothetical protein